MACPIPNPKARLISSLQQGDEVQFQVEENGEMFTDVIAKVFDCSAVTISGFIVGCQIASINKTGRHNDEFVISEAAQDVIAAYLNV